jgi:hypothetical protein
MFQATTGTLLVATEAYVQIRFLSSPLMRCRSSVWPSQFYRFKCTSPQTGICHADNLFYIQGKFPAIATKNDLYMALAYTVRDRLLQHWIDSIETYLKDKELKLVCYLSAEFLLGPRLGNSLINLDIA